MSNVRVTTNKTSRQLKAFKRAPSLGLSMWHFGKFDDKPCGKERYQRSLLFSGVDLSTRKRTASTCAQREDELFLRPGRRVRRGTWERKLSRWKLGNACFSPDSSRTHLLSARLGFAPSLWSAPQGWKKPFAASIRLLKVWNFPLRRSRIRRTPAKPCTESSS